MTCGHASVPRTTNRARRQLPFTYPAEKNMGMGLVLPDNLHQAQSAPFAASAVGHIPQGTQACNSPTQAYGFCARQANATALQLQTPRQTQSDASHCLKDINSQCNSRIKASRGHQFLAPISKMISQAAGEVDLRRRSHGSKLTIKVAL